MRNPEIGWENGEGRSMGPGDQIKARQMPQQLAYKVAVEQLRNQKDAFQGNQKTFTSPPKDFKPEFWYPLAGEPAVRLRGNACDEVFTSLNGLDADLWEAYPDDPEMVRLIVRSKIQFVGIVDQNARTDLQSPLVTVQFAGTVSQYAPGIYNTPGRENAAIQFCDAVVYDVPNLQNPIVAGFPKQIGKIVMVPCPVTKESLAARIMRQVGHIVHDPAKYKRVMHRYEHIANANINAALALRNAAFVNGLMMVDLLLKANVLSVSNAAPELAAGVAAGDTATITANLAEALSLLHPSDSNVAVPGAFAASLTQEQVQKYKRLEFDLAQRLFPVANPDTGKFNARTEFGMSEDELRGPVSTARSTQTGEILRTPVGRLLHKSLTAGALAIQSMAFAIDEETRNRAGWAASTPNQAGVGIFNLCLVPQGGMSAKNI